MPWIWVDAQAIAFIGEDGNKYKVTPGRAVYFIPIGDDTALTVEDGKQYFTVPPLLNGMNLVDADAMVATASSSGLPTVQIHRVRGTADMLSTRITIDENEFNSYDATTPPVIDDTKDDVVTGDVLRIDVDVSGTGTKGLHVVLTFRLP